MFSFLSRKKEAEKDIPKTIEECREHFKDQEFDIEKMLQPSDKVHDYNHEDLMLNIKSTYENLGALSKMMDKVLDHTTHLPNFRFKCKTFIEMSYEIDELTHVAVTNLKKKGKIKSTSEFQEMSESLKEDLKKLTDEIGEINLESTKSTSIFNELSADSFRLTDAEIKKLEEEAKEEEKKLEEEDPFGASADDPEKLDPSSKKEIDEKIMSRADDLVKETEKITQRKNVKNEKLMKDLKNGKKEIWIQATTVWFINFAKMLKKITDALEQAVETKKSEYLRQFVSYASQIPIVGNILYGALKDDPDWIYYKPLDHPDWDLLFSCYDYVKPKKLKTFMSQYQRICEFMAYLSAVLGREDYQKGNKIFSLLKSAKWAAYYALFEQRRTEQFNLFMSNPDVDVALKVYNLQDTMFLQDVLKIIYPSVKLHKVIYIPMLTEQLTVNNLSTTLKNFNKGGRHKEKNFPLAVSGIDNNFEVFSDGKYDPAKYVKVRIFSNVQFPMDWETNTVLPIDKPIQYNQGDLFNSLVKDTKKKVQTASCGCCGLWSSRPRRQIKQLDSKKLFDEVKNTKFQLIEIPAIWIHIHGGGFVSMSSASHQAYTRVWASESEVPIFSIDYRLAPESAYPAALNDVWQAYYWIVTYCRSKLGIAPKKVFVAGDSAGGNLTYALTNLAIANGFKVPDMILPHYPAMIMSSTMFSPSLLLAWDDFILPAGFLQLCIESYVKDADAENDPFLSPAVTPENILQKYPPVRLLIAGNDPLRDESFKFVLKLAKLKKDIKFIEYQMFPHAFLNFDIPIAGISECEKPIKKGVHWLKEFANKGLGELQ